MRRYSRFLPRRRVCEVMVANTNPWILLAMEGNFEIDIITATPEKVFGYVTKGSQQKSLVRAVAELQGRAGGGACDHNCCRNNKL